MNSFEDIIRRILREEFNAYFSSQSGEEMRTDCDEDPDGPSERLDIREAVAESIPPVAIEVDAKGAAPMKLDKAEEITVEAVRDYCKETDTKPADAKLALAQIGFAKFSSVPDSEATRVYKDLMEALK